MTSHMLWVDLETTGLSVLDDFIVEVAVILTEATGPEYREIARGEWVVCPDRDYRRTTSNYPAIANLWRSRMTEYVVEMHTGTGLLDLIPDGSTLPYVSEEIVNMLRGAGVVEGDVVLAGSGVSHFDHEFVKVHLPAVAAYLRYATLDVGVLRRSFEFVGRDDLMANGDTFTETAVPHRAMADIDDHLNEWRTYAPLLRGIALP